ncbi:hypothetical protein E0H73_17495 [Kribbella pittospori]|uniref:Uncharacterized protein n=1 Tax=Kribbella pittospori TaxID=722689 RepID=A0A4V2MAY0_9ACTN|nr:DUF6882 domain-containing protein [Kribbella pittospori]TCC61052.1 hypothetical protein E0H73_17495 [Kribbella pittospori]
MGLFKRATKPASEVRATADGELATMLLQGENMVEQLAKAHLTWGLGSADRWDLDQTTGLITWSFPDKVATAPAQILGSFSPTSGTWLWAWANQSILPELSRDALAVRDWAMANGQEALARAKVEADEQLASTLVALAVRITKARGFYRAPSGNSVVVITFGPVTLTAADGSTSTVAIEVG